MTRQSVPWTAVASRLATERSYWLGTVGPDCSPHVAPLWGVVLADTWYCYTERTTRKARNLANDPRVTLHLGDGDDVVIVHGTLRDLDRPTLHPDVVSAFEAKYNRPEDQPYLPLADPSFDVLYVLLPRSALLWALDDYEGSQRRWNHDGG